MEQKQQKPLRIAMLGHKRVPSREGGVEVVVEELSTRLSQLGHQVTCYNRGGHHCCGRAYDEPARAVYKGIHIKRLFTVDVRGLAAVTSSVAGAFLTAFGRYDVVHFHAEGTCGMLWLPKLLGKRCVVTVHGLDHRRAKWGPLARRYLRFGERCAARWADEIIVLSRETQRYFRATYGRETTYIPNGVNKPVLRPAQQIAAQFGLGRGAYILFLGRLVPEKGLDRLIAAFRQVNTAKRLVIAGGACDTEAYVERLKRAARGDERILFTGFVQGAVLEELYSNAYCYVLPSELEGMPLSLLEAMSYGNCCLVSDIPECRETACGRAIAFDPGSTEQLRAALQQLCDDPAQVERFARQTASFAIQTYTWDMAVARTLCLYRAKGKSLARPRSWARLRGLYGGPA